MKKIKIGVLGLYRGSSMINYCTKADNAEVVALCDKWEEGIKRQKEQNAGLNITYYTDFDEFIKHDMDAVVLANYANEHAPFAIKALKAGKHVFSEVLPFQTMQEAVELIETVEQTGKIYAYGENYCYMTGPMEMKKLYLEDKIGELEYAECEYFHNCESIWPSIAYGDKNHWRNNMYSTFYCTHSFGPILHITGLRPKKVVGFEPTGIANQRNDRMGSKGAAFGIEMVTLENGALVKSGHGGKYTNSIWYSISGTKGSIETGREDAQSGGTDIVYVHTTDYPSGYSTEKLINYRPSQMKNDLSANFGHGGSDFWSMYYFVEKIKGDENADIIDVYEAVDSALVGHFAYRSILGGGITMEIPDLKDKQERDKWRNDVACCSVEVAGKDVWPSRSSGTLDISDEVYARQRKLFEQDLISDSGYSSEAFKQNK